MNHFSRLGALTLLAGGAISFAPLQARGAELLLQRVPSLLLSSTPQGYLGVGLMGVDSDRATALKLKEAGGVEIITVDQDAPAAKAGLKIHDVVLQMNGQRIDNLEQFRRMLRETPPGRTVQFTAMRDGQPINLTAQLGDRATVMKNSMTGIGDLPGDHAQEATVAPLQNGSSSGAKRSSGYRAFLEPFSRNRIYVGIDLQPLTSGLADYFGVHDGTGLLVGNVFPNSPGATAGLKPADIIQRVNGQPIVTVADWERAIHVNRGKQVQVTIIREKKEQTLSMVAGEAKNNSQLTPPSKDASSTALLAELRREKMD